MSYVSVRNREMSFFLVAGICPADFCEHLANVALWIWPRIMVDLDLEAVGGGSRNPGICGQVEEVRENFKNELLK